MKVEELAKMLNVNRGTIWYWKKHNKLDEKLAEYEKQAELKKKVTEQDSLQVILQKQNEITEILENVQYMLQQVLQMSQNSSKISQNVVNISQDVVEMSQDVEGYLTTVEVAHALGIARRSLNDRITDGKIKAIKVKGKNLIPKEEAFQLIFKKVYDDVNLKTKAGDSVSIKNFKDELKKVINLSEEEVNRELNALDDEEILHLQTINNPDTLTEEERKAAIEFNGRMLFYITWMKK